MLDEVVGAILELFGLFDNRRVTVADRYEMKRKVRALRKKEADERLERDRKRATGG